MSLLLSFQLLLDPPVNYPVGSTYLLKERLLEIAVVSLDFLKTLHWWIGSPSVTFELNPAGQGVSTTAYAAPLLHETWIAALGDQAYADRGIVRRVAPYPPKSLLPIFAKTPGSLEGSMISGSTEKSVPFSVTGRRLLSHSTVFSWELYTGGV